MGPETLSQVLRELAKNRDPRLLVGMDTSDDAAVYQLNQDTALVFTLDFFAPVADDPYIFGSVAAANALSDVYAMGGDPLLAMNIACFPDCLDLDTQRQILQGGADKVTEAGAITAGGHTVDDREPKYGLAVLGTVHPQRVVTNAGGRPGDLLLLTKPLGLGAILTAGKADLAPREVLDRAFAVMQQLNREAALAMREVGVSAATDITGFGFLGHLYELARASGVQAEVWAQRVPLLPGARDLAAMGLLPGGAHRNRDYLREQVEIGAEVDQTAQDLFFDPQTSGGMLLAVPPDKLSALQTALAQRGLEPAEPAGRLQSGPAGSIRLR